MLEDALTLTTCTLRRLVPSDAGSIARYANNPKVARWMRHRFPSPYQLTDAESFIALDTGDEASEKHFAIEVDGDAVGVIGLMPGEPGEVHQRTAEIGYWIGEPYWGRGIASDAALALSDAAFAEGRLLRIYASVYDGNTNSCRVLEKAGFEKEGIMRAYVEKNGEILDAHLYAKLSPALRNDLK